MNPSRQSADAGVDLKSAVYQSKGSLFRIILISLVCALSPTSNSQDRLPNMPRYDRFEKLQRQISGSVSGGAIKVEWASDSKSFTFDRDGKSMRYDLATGEANEVQSNGEFDTGGSITKPRFSRPTPDRGRQFKIAFSSDEKWKAECKDRNVYINPIGDTAIQITSEGSVEKRIKCGMASWVYGEELGQRDAMWWSPDSKKLAYYRFDESQVPDYYVTLAETAIQNKLDTEAYPKPGDPGPSVELRIYDVASKSTTSVEVGFRSTGDPDLGTYVYAPRWSNDGKSLLFFRMNRKQNFVEFCAADAETGRCKVIFQETNPEGWVEFSPKWLWSDPNPEVAWKNSALTDPQRFLWISDRDGFRNLYLYDLNGKLVKQITSNRFDAQQVVSVDKRRGLIWYTAHDGDVPYKVQLHRVALTGSDTRITDPAFNHSVQLAPDGQHFIDIAQSLVDPPRTLVCDGDGKRLQTLAMSDTSKYENLGLQRAQRVEFKAADHQTDLYGYITFPSDFDPSKKYPVIINAYGGPGSGTAIDAFRTPEPITELGFIVAWFDGRGTDCRGRAFRQSVYRKLGTVEIDDQAAGASYLQTLPFVDASRIGIQGTSYGGYAALMALLRFPDIFVAACASSPVTDWRNYDSTYTERYMDTPRENAAGYDAGSAINLAKGLKGNLLLYFGTADNNVHPSNTIQLVQALTNSGKYFEMMLGPDLGHTQVNAPRMWEFFVEHLILDARKSPLEKAWTDRRITQRITAKH